MRTHCTPKEERFDVIYLTPAAYRELGRKLRDRKLYSDTLSSDGKPMVKLDGILAMKEQRRKKAE